MSAPPADSAQDIMNRIKGATSLILREEFAELGSMPGLWTRNYFVSTEDEIDSNVIRMFVGSQKKRA